MPTINQNTPPAVDRIKFNGIIFQAVQPAPNKIQNVPAHFRYQLRPCDGVTLSLVITNNLSINSYNFLELHPVWTYKITWRIA